jgi:hypothetical protein
VETSQNRALTPGSRGGRELNTPYLDGEAFITVDGSELWFTSDRPGGKGAGDIYRVPILEGP